MSDTMGLHGTALTHDISSFKRYLDHMKMGVVVNLDCHLISLQRKMTPQGDVGTGEGGSRETSIGKITNLVRKHSILASKLVVYVTLMRSLRTPTTTGSKAVIQTMA